MQRQVAKTDMVPVDGRDFAGCVHDLFVIRFFTNTAGFPALASSFATDRPFLIRGIRLDGRLAPASNVSVVCVLMSAYWERIFAKSLVPATKAALVTTRNATV